jgi:uncharacterized protein YutE (UPF0331/DUF86 family)
MYLHEDEAKKLLKVLRKTLINELFDKMDYLQELLEADDWTMIVKSYSLIEKVITDLIISKIEEPQLKNVISRLPLADEEIGKLLITKDYSLLSDSQRKFIKKLSALRNKLVHNYEYVNFDLKNYIESLEKNQIKSWHEAVTWFAEDSEAKEQWLAISKKTPKIALWFSMFTIISKLIIKEKEYFGLTELNKQVEITSIKILKEFIKL